MFLLDSTANEPSIMTVVIMGIGIVFIGLTLIIIMCKILGLVVGSSKEAVSSVSAPVQQAVSEPIQNKGELVAAISSAVAESLGKDVSAIRILSIKKV
jgi:sodium pump decarboxylase gamma subunit